MSNLNNTTTMTLGNILRQAAIKQANFTALMQDFGKTTKTTFYSDYTIADLCGGVKAVKDTYNRSVKAWLNNIEYITEMYIVLNHKIWEHYESNEELARCYNELWEDLYSKITEHYANDDEKLSYFYNESD